MIGQAHPTPRHAWFSALCGLVCALLAGCGGHADSPVPAGGGGPAALSAGGTAGSIDTLGTPGPPAPRTAADLPAPGQGAAGWGQARAGIDGGYSVDTSSRDQVVLFYRTVFASSDGVASGWVGNIAGCDAGDTSAEFKAATLRRINWYRAMAGVPAGVQLDASFNSKAQQAAMLMSANGQNNHFPPTSWTCYNAVAAEGAGKSNLALNVTGAAAVSNYIIDPGANNTAVGHRRWLLYPQTLLMGTGDTSGATPSNALWVVTSNYFSARPPVRDDFVAWPPKGYVPYKTVGPRWSLSYPGGDFSAANVSMKENGSAIATRLEVVATSPGENTLVWLPGTYVDGMGWSKPAADTRYEVTVSNVLVDGAPRAFSYSVMVFDPDQDVSPAMSLKLTGPDSTAPGQGAVYGFSPIAGAQSYEWRALATAPFTLDDGAEAGAVNLKATTGPGYSAVSTDLASSGSRSFHLARTDATDQVLQLNARLVGSARGLLRFSSLLGYATTSQVARVEASTNEGATWLPLYQQHGTETSAIRETTFFRREVSLAALADKLFLLRFIYTRDSTVNNLTAYNQSSSGFGWYVDDIHIEGVDAVTVVGGSNPVAGNGFTLATSGTGPLVLQVRPLMYGQYGYWGDPKRVASAAGLDARDCFFNWAERGFPSWFPTPAVAQSLPPFYLRYYPGTNVYLGFSGDTERLYLLSAGGLTDLGAQGAWLGAAGCR